MSTFVGRRPASDVPPKAEPETAKPADKTRAELVAEAESLGIDVPPKANKARIQALIDGTPVI